MTSMIMWRNLLKLHLALLSSINRYEEAKLKCLMKEADRSGAPQFQFLQRSQPDVKHTLSGRNLAHCVGTPITAAVKQVANFE